jgi:lipopolysaccharide biosynthesis regulator YciM
MVASKSQERKIDSLILKAVCFREQGDTERAIEILSDTLTLPEINDDELLGVKYELAICREALGEIVLARQLYTEIMTERPDFSDTASRIDSLQNS